MTRDMSALQFLFFRDSPLGSNQDKAQDRFHEFTRTFLPRILRRAQDRFHRLARKNKKQ